MNDARYSGVAMALHWAMALLLAGLLILGFYMHGLSLSPRKLQLFSWHKWAGVTAFLLAVVRMAWRFTHRPPDLPDGMPKLMQFAAHAGHLALYLLMIAIPLLAG
jgi:cytochrome b561